MKISQLMKEDDEEDDLIGLDKDSEESLDSQDSLGSLNSLKSYKVQISDLQQEIREQVVLVKPNKFLYK